MGQAEQDRDMNKLIYIANARIPTEKAHGVQIMKMCGAFAGQGIEVELVVPGRKTPIKEDPFKYYGVKDDFKIRKLWCLDAVKFGRVGFWIEALTFTCAVFCHTLAKGGPDVIYYTRDESMAFCLKLLGKKTVWEAHMGQKNLFVRALIIFKVPLVAISKGLKDLYAKLGVPIDRIAVAPDGVDLDQFDLDISKEKAREKLGLDNNSKLVVYTGSRFSWKGVDTLEKAGDLLPNGIEVLIVSGKPYTEIPLYLKAADVLVLPNTAKEKISNRYTSPMKLFEYMASGRPIIASDLPSIREVLDESAAYFFEPDRPESLKEVIMEALKDEADSMKRAGNALRRVKEYSWEKRGQKIMNFIIRQIKP